MIFKTQERLYQEFLNLYGYNDLPEESIPISRNQLVKLWNEKGFKFNLDEPEMSKFWVIVDSIIKKKKAKENEKS
ncbi:MAG: hypothetical protein ACOCP4_02895 [Candidatus Woesearchaeota archaeon]